MNNSVPRILKIPILAMYYDDKRENLTLEVELPDVRSENITLVMHENSFYLKAFSKSV
jgi:HSP20 family molecular chaperone IbpA